jgi:hypothetical protein
VAGPRRARRWLVNLAFTRNHVRIEKAAENGALSSTPQLARLAALTFFLPREPPPQTLLLTFFDMHSHSPSPLLPPGHPVLRGTYFGSTSSVPKMDPSPSTLRIMARGRNVLL